MPFVQIEKLIQLQNEISKLRNICILAHVDHGKTTLADSLISSNGIISKRMAGKLRYLDNRTDEQERGITMKCSSISLFYESIKSEEFLINLIDSPGHVDFSSEVSTAVRLCDGAIVVVDVVEGVCPQTRQCLQQIYSEQLKPVLLLNKIDRLILEKKMSPLDAYIHITQVLEQVNAVIGNIIATKVIANEDSSSTVDNNYISALDDLDDSEIYFQPERGNVVFCSAIDGWAFSIRDFANMYSERLGMSVVELNNVLFGDFYYNTKKKSAVPGAQEKAKKPMFVQFIFENIWNLYDLIIIRKDREKIPLITEKLGFKLTTRDLRVTDPRVQLKCVFEQWLPIDRSVLEMVVEQIPPPNSISDDRAEKLLCPYNCDFKNLPPETQILKNDFKNCNSQSETVIVFVSKMVPFDKSQLPKNKPKRVTQEELDSRRELVKQKILERKKVNETNGLMSEAIDSGMKNLSLNTPSDLDKIPESKEDEVGKTFIAFARIFSGTLVKGMKLYVLSPKHDPRNLDVTSGVEKSLHINEAVIENLYLLMGSELEELNKVPAGNLVGIGGLEDLIVKTSTLSTTCYCPSFAELSLMATPIFKVALETVNPSEMSKLIKGLKLLNQADACVQISVQETGEHVITTLGEVHVEKCVRDLEENYAKVKINVSEPIVSLRETIVPESKIDMVNEIIENVDNDLTKKIVTVFTSNKLGFIKLLAVPLNNDVVNLMDSNHEFLKLLSYGSTKNSCLSEKQSIQINKIRNILNESLKGLDLKKFSTVNENLADKIWCIGSKKCPTNILLNLTDYLNPNFWRNNFEDINISDIRKDYNSSFVNGFQITTGAGPLCEEPMTGVCFVLLEWKIEAESSNLNSKTYGPFSGQVMSMIKEGCKKAFQNQPQRLVTPMYSCNIIANAEVLGKMYAVIGRRHGKVVSGDLTHGSGNFSVTAYLPVIESFNFTHEIRKQTSGLAYPQLVFSHWEIIDVDPFWVPSTEEEYLHFGEKADADNRARTYLDKVRRRKGLSVEEKLVEFGEKQRTLSKNK